MENDEMREKTGDVVGTRLDAFLYLLMRDHMPLGKVDELVNDLEKTDLAEFTNSHLANYAKSLVERLTQ